MPTARPPNRGHGMKRASPAQQRCHDHAHTNTVTGGEIQVTAQLVLSGPCKSHRWLCSPSKLGLLTLLPRIRHFPFSLKCHFSITLLEMVLSFLDAHNISPIYSCHHSSFSWNSYVLCFKLSSSLKCLTPVGKEM